VARPHIESIAAYGVAAAEVAAGAFAGSRRRSLSEDDADGSSTALFSFPAGWARDIGGSRPVELLVLSGGGALGATPLRPGTWAWVPAGAAGATLRLDEPADVLVMVEPERAPGGEIEIVDVVRARFEEVHVVDGVPAGLALKTLRVDPQLGERSWIAGTAPGWLGFRGEIHPTVEEAFLVRGDCLLANSGPMVAGDYFWRPGGIHHGPFATRAGMLYFFRTKGGDLEVEWDDPDGWDAESRRYYDAEPWFAPGR
jgi:hypothetical protein